MEHDQYGIKDRVAERLLRIPGVHGVAVGCKLVGGAMSDQLAVLVFTERKRCRAALSRRDRIPAFFDGLPTDVIEMTRPVCYGTTGGEPEGKPAKDYSIDLDPTLILSPDNAGKRPLLGGLMISSNLLRSDEPKGTLGFFLTPAGDTQTGYAVGCHHTFFFQAASKAERETTFQPAEDTSTCCAGDFSIGVLVDAQCDELYDIALIRLNNGMKWQPMIRDIGMIKDIFTGIPFDKNASQRVLIPQRVKVKKYGITTGETGGEVFASGFIGTVTRRDPNTGMSVVSRSNAKGLLVQPRPRAEDWKEEVVFAAPGDSGAAVLTVADNKLVGILTGGARMQLGSTGRFWGVGFVTPIQIILDRYNGSTVAGVPQLVVATGAAESDVRTVPGAARVALPADALLDRRQAAALEQQVRRSPTGNALADIYRTHGREVRDLVNRNRRVATVWHRSGVAFLVQQLLRAYRDPCLRIPEIHEGRLLADGLRQFGAVLSRFGSEALRTDVARFVALTPDVGGLTFGEIMERLGVPRPDAAGV